MTNFKIFKRPLRFVLFFALIFGANLAIAEESGGFVGFSIGVGQNYANFEKTEQYPNYNNGEPLVFNANEMGAMGASYGFTLGYKQFFNRYLGLRYYANVNTTYGNMDDFGSDNGMKNKFKIYSIAYNANIDFMGNFISTKSVDFGAFVGFGLGAVSWRSKMLQLYYASSVGISPKTTGFDIPINAGLRVNFAHYHGIELLTRFHFLTTRFIDYYEREMMKWHFDLGRRFSLLLRYTISF